MLHMSGFYWDRLFQAIYANTDVERTISLPEYPMRHTPEQKVAYLSWEGIYHYFEIVLPAINLTHPIVNLVISGPGKE